MKTYNYKKNQLMFKKASKKILCGIYGHYSPAPLIPTTDYPFFTSKAKGSKFWDVDNNVFIDYMCAYGPMVLGYSNKKIDIAAIKELQKGNTTTAASPIMIELAEYLVNMIEGVNWAFFAKNGADVVNYAAMIAKSATGREKIIIMNGCYHGTSPWMQTTGHHGVTEDDKKNIISVNWNDFNAFENAVNSNSNEIACLIATPYHVPTFNDNELPADGYWQKVDSLCKKEGIVLVSDDIRHGFRIDLKGSHNYFGYKPDLVCFSKAMGNGYSISALCGTEEIRNDAASVFHTGSFWFQSEPMAASLATLKELKRLNAPKIMKQKGEKLLHGLVKLASNYGYNLKISGYPTMPYIRITNDESLMLHQDWCGECTKRGAYFTSHHNWFLSTAHSDSDIKKTLEIADESFKIVKKKYGDEY